MQPSDFLTTFGLGSGSPCLRPTSSADVSSLPGYAGIRLRAPVGDWSPALRTTGLLRGVVRISQVPGPSSSYAPRSITPPGVPSPRPPLSAMALLPSKLSASWAPGIVISFRGRIPAAHTFVDLRIAVAVTRSGARPYYRPAGLSFGRVGFAPTGRLTEFQLVSPPPFRSDQPCLVASLNRKYELKLGSD